MKFIIADLKKDEFKKYKNDVYKLRHKVFKESLNWNVETVDGDKEIDYFDSLSTLFYILVIDSNKKLIGCLRLLPTENDYMLEKVFPQLLNSQNIPKSQSIWELSRFAVNPELKKEANVLKFNKVTLFLIKGICVFAKIMNIESYLAVTTNTMNRLVKRLKMDVKVIGTTIKIENTNVIALQVFMTEKSFNAIDYALN